MNKKTMVMAALALAGAGAAGAQANSAAVGEVVQATDLRLYSDFAEVRQPVTSEGRTLEVVWPESAWSGLLPGSLDLEGLAYARAVHTTQASWLEALEGRELTLREEGREPETVTLVRAEDMTVRDHLGEYRRVSAGDLAFPELPPQRGYGALPVSTFDLGQEGGAGTLSYLTRSLTWQPRYTLRVGDGVPQLTALADMTNDADLTYAAGGVELLAGEVNLNHDYGGPMFARAEMAVADAAPSSAPASIAQQESLNGIYRYALSEPVTLPARSVVTLPFMQPKLSKFEAFAGLDTRFSPRPSEGVLNRLYRFTADRDLPTGNLTVREGGRVTGQTRVPETAAGRDIEFALGRDPDVGYKREVQPLRSTDKQRVYKVTYTLTNDKAETVRAEISEYAYARKVAFEGKGITPVEEGMQLSVDVPAGGAVTRSFTLTMTN